MEATMTRPLATLCQVIALTCLAGLLLLGAGAASGQQNIFATVARVNDGVVTAFEVSQRARLLAVLRTPNASAETALETLIDDRVKQDAARAAGITPTQEDIDFGIEDFAARANLTGEEFLIAVAEVGIAPETVRDYVAILLSWGEVVRERFTARARPSDAEIDRAIALGSGSQTTRVLLSEIILPMNSEIAAATQERAAAIAELRSFEAFSTAARRFSVAPTRNNGGQLDWLNLAELPPEIGPILLSLQPGDVTQPIGVQGGIALFQLRAIEDRRPPLSGDAALDYMRLRFPPGTDLAGETARILASADQCDDLFGLFRGAGENQLQRVTENRSALPGAVALALDRLDPGEVAAIGPQASGDGGSIVMLCERAEIREEDVNREDVRRQVFVRRLEAFGDSYLAELRADAFIEIVQ
jgi:peptidyl-prolyl cis-trans isomerase SurA